MTLLIAAALVFLALHLLIAGTRVRDAIVAAIGERAYLGLFSLASVGAIVWLAMSYRAALVSSSNIQLFDLGDGVDNLAIPIVLIAFLLGVPGLLTANPSSVGQSGCRGQGRNGARSLAHHAASFSLGRGDLVPVPLLRHGRLCLGSSSSGRSSLSRFSAPLRSTQSANASWVNSGARLPQRTSNLPFAAIAAGRNSFRASEYFDWRFLVALALFVVVLFAHARVIGVSPFPGGWAPF